MKKAIKDYIIKIRALNTIKQELETICISKAYPTQYEIRYLGVMGAYIRFRGGLLSVYLTPNAVVDHTSIAIYAKDFGDRRLNSMSEKQIDKYISMAKTALAKSLIYDAIASREELI